MNFLVLSDIHADTVHLEKLDVEFARADVVLFAGDFTNETESEKGLPILETLIKKHDALLAVIGNCDQPSFLEELEKHDVSVQGDIVFRDGLFFLGSGGALKFTGTTPNERTEEDLMNDLQMVFDRSAEYEDYPPDMEESSEDDKNSAPFVDKLASSPAQVPAGLEWNNLILIVHQPPHNTKLDVITSGIHVGSPAYRHFIEEYQPFVSISGHIHESAAIDTIGKTTLINPGSLAAGQYAVLNVQKQNGVWKVVNAELKDISRN